MKKYKNIAIICGVIALIVGIAWYAYAAEFTQIPGCVLHIKCAEKYLSNGTDQISNSEFTTDLTGWTAANYTQSRVDSGADPGSSSGGADDYCLKGVATADASRSHNYTTSTVDGATYYFSTRFYIPTGDPGLYGTLGSVSNIVQGTEKDAWTQKTTYITAADTNANLYIGNLSSGGAVGDICYLDAVHLYPVQVADLSGNGNHASLYGATTSGAINWTTDSHGNSNRALAFDGSADYLLIADKDSLSFGDGSSDSAFSVVARVKMDDATKFKVAAKGVYNTDAEWIFETNANDDLQIRFFDESVDNCYIGRRYETAITDYEGSWITLIATYSGSGASSGIVIYIDGVQVDDTNVQAGSYVAMENLTADVHIGRNGSDYAEGNIEFVMVFNHVLTATEIDLISNAYNSGVQR